MDLIINELKELQSQIHTLERQKIAAEKERDARSRKLEYLESENKRYVYDSNVWAISRGLKTRLRLNESFQRCVYLATGISQYPRLMYLN